MLISDDANKMRIYEEMKKTLLEPDGSQDIHSEQG